ncbi:hypothetical protein SAMN05444673_5549 [Bacillus sp. OV166]|nr:hypothetical protein COE25_02180 [Bacillus sp. AFS031507]SMQ83753.1 hypothetical protein SAMN05444673_5549 [Bacillus sp. OV166]
MREMIRLLFNKRFRKTFFMFMGFFIAVLKVGKFKRFVSNKGLALSVYLRVRPIFTYTCNKINIFLYIIIV